MLHIEAIKTEIFHQDSNQSLDKSSQWTKGLNRLADFIVNAISNHVKDGDVLAVTSKVFSVAENQMIPKDSIEKRALIEKEADLFLGEGPYGVCLTIKHGIFIPSAGIDESNSEKSAYLLFPEDPFKSADFVRKQCQKKLGLKHFGLIMTDSHTTALRWGVTGIALAFSGFMPVRNLVGQKDLFGRELHFTRVNAVDALSAAAVYEMGEANECTPLALIRGAAIEFSEADHRMDVRIPPEEDLYRDFFKFNESQTKK